MENNLVSYEEQIRQGLRRTPNYLPAKAENSIEFHDNERGMLANAVNAAGIMMTQRPMTPIVRSDDTAVTQAYASLIYSAAYAVASALITGGLIVMAWGLYGGAGGQYALLWLLSWGICILVALIINRAQGLQHSATGIAHHEIDSRERLARYAIDQHIRLIENRWRIKRP